MKLGNYLNVVRVNQEAALGVGILKEGALGEFTNENFGPAVIFYESGFKQWSAIGARTHTLSGSQAVILHLSILDRYNVNYSLMQGRYSKSSIKIK